MPAVNPFHAPAALVATERLTAYWACTAAAAAYVADSEVARQLHLDAGAEEFTRVDLATPFIPVADISIWAGNRAVVVIRGTSNYQQMAVQIGGTPLVTRSPWPGLVGNAHSALAVLTWPEVLFWLNSFVVEEVALVGHSLGGAVAALFNQQALTSSAAVPVALWTYGAPRVGNGTYAVTQTTPAWRLTNHGDPVWALPPSPQPGLDSSLWILPVPVLTSYQHWGRRGHLFEGGGVVYPPGDLPSLIGAADLLYDLVVGTQTWYADHDPEEYARRLRIGMLDGDTVPPEVAQVDEAWEVIEEPDIIEQWFDPRTCR